MLLLLLLLDVAGGRWRCAAVIAGGDADVIAAASVAGCHAFIIAAACFCCRWRCAAVIAGGDADVIAAGSVAGDDVLLLLQVEKLFLLLLLVLDMRRCFVLFNALASVADISPTVNDVAVTASGDAEIIAATAVGKGAAL